MERAIRIAQSVQSTRLAVRSLNTLFELYRIPLRSSTTRRRRPRPLTYGMMSPSALHNRTNTSDSISSKLDQSDGHKYAEDSIRGQLLRGVQQRHSSLQQNSGEQPIDPTKDTRDSYTTFHTLGDGTTYEETHFNNQERATIKWEDFPQDFRDNFLSPAEIAKAEIFKSASTTAEPTLALDELTPELREVFDTSGTDTLTSAVNLPVPGDSESRSPPSSPSKKLLKKQQRIAHNKEFRKASRELHKRPDVETPSDTLVMTSNPPSDPVPAQHKPLVVGRTKPQAAMTDTNPPEAKADLNKEIEENLKSNTGAAAPADEASVPPPKKKEKAPKQPKPPKAAPPTAPLSPALIDLRVGHILRAINHPSADSLYVSTIAMGDSEGTEHTQVDEETGKVVRTVCSGLNGLVPLADMQDRKIVVVANLKPVNMRSIKSAAMVLAASPKAEEGADPHAPDRVVELVSPPEGSEAGDPVYFEGWEYGEGKGPEKQLNPKKKQWEAIQPGFYTTDDLVAAFDAGTSEVEGDKKGELVVKGKGKCTVKTLKGAVIR